MCAKMNKRRTVLVLAFLLTMTVALWSLKTKTVHSSGSHGDVDLLNVANQRLLSVDSLDVVKYSLLHDDLLPEAKLPNTNYCRSYREQWNMTWHVSKNVFRANIKHRSSITMVTHMSLARLAALKLILKLWTGPVSVSMYLERQKTHSVLRELQEFFSKDGRHNVFVHLVFSGNELYYPGNLLRNIAVEGVETEFSFLNDGDFLPSTNAEARLSEYKQQLQQKQVFILPAFAFLENHPPDDLSVLADKQKLVEAVTKEQPTIQDFSKYVFVGGHAATNFSKWYSAEKMYPVQYQAFFEPYVLIHTSDVLHYPELFVGWFFDKLSLFELFWLNFYEFVVLPDVYVVHYYHPRNHDKIKNTYNRCAIMLHDQWWTRLAKRYNLVYEKKSTSSKGEVNNPFRQCEVLNTHRKSILG